MVNRKLVKATQNLFRQIRRLAKQLTKGFVSWFLRGALVAGRRSRMGTAGFVLPAVAMVILVVVLLTTAMLLRSFDRSRNAANYRVNEVVLNATAPAIDRARAKLSALFNDPSLPRATPSETALDSVLTGTKYTLGDETPIQIAYNISRAAGGSDSTITTTGTIDQQEVLKTAWKFPIDTNNNGKFDSYTLYGIYFRSPGQTSSGNFNRPRMPLDSRTPPMTGNVQGGRCDAAVGSTNLVGTSGWYQRGARLAKGVFVYAVNVPIRSGDSILTTNSTQYESFPGGTGFSAVEYQQDRTRKPLRNNAVVYEDDLDITVGGGIRVNGAMRTNSNLMLARDFNPVEVYLVSSAYSCYNLQENSKILVGGNVVAGAPDWSGYRSEAPVHLFAGRNTTPSTSLNVNSTDDSTSAGAPNLVAYNSQEYVRRLNVLINAQITANPLPSSCNATDESTADPDDVRRLVRAADCTQKLLVRQDALKTWFRDRTRRVPFNEVAFGTTPTDPSPLIQGTGNTLRPNDAWHYPFAPTDGTTATGYATLTLSNISSPASTMQLQATQPSQQIAAGREYFLGDRILVGNNLPAQWWKSAAFVGLEGQQPITGRFWSTTGSTTSTVQRYRMTQVDPIPDTGNTGRDGYWELVAAQIPSQPLEGVGGLRIVTGAGLYSGGRGSSALRRSNAFDSYSDIISGANKKAPWEGVSFLPNPPSSFIQPSATAAQRTYSGPTKEGSAGLETYDDPTTPGTTELYPIVWPDEMPMTPGPLIEPGQTDILGTRGDLVMRASAVYSYRGPNGATAPSGTSYGIQVQNGVIVDPTTYQAPIACVSSYYDPTNGTTARNYDGLPDVARRRVNDIGSIRTLSLSATVPDGSGGRSNNGVSYGPPTLTAKDIPTGSGTLTPTSAQTEPDYTSASSATAMRTLLDYQANLVFPNGRFVNSMLRQALKRIDAGGNLSLAEQSAIDATICSIQIVNGTVSVSDTVVPHGAIVEVALSNAREIRSNSSVADSNATFTGVGPMRPVSVADNIEGRPTSSSDTAATAPYPLQTNYTMAIEERQPLEVRATALDLDLLRRMPIGQTTNAAAGIYQEYLLPNSGVIYASRDDALPDLSDPLPNNPTDNDRAVQQRNSPVDYDLDPTRRPNGIMLINGSQLARNDADGNGQNDAGYVQVERGLILASDLPVYVYGTFNPHSAEEFTVPLVQSDWSNFYSRGNPSNSSTGIPDPNFACMAGDPRLTSLSPACTTADSWRPATVLADAITVLSNNFILGYRSDVDFDLRNNAGLNGAIKNRISNGFLANYYAANSDWAASVSGDGRAVPALMGSYLNNYVAPVQRRVRFSEYLMEYCPKLLITECGENDWWVDAARTRKATSAVIGQTPAAIGATTTATRDFSGALANIRRYPRRIAYQRKSTGALVTTKWKSLTNSTPIPLAIRGDGTIQPFPYSSDGGTTESTTTRNWPVQSTDLPRLADAALWYATTTANNSPTTASNRMYGLANNNQSQDGGLYYSPNSILGAPPVTDIAPFNGLNSGANPPYNYLICTNTQGFSVAAGYGSTSTLTSSCPADTKTSIATLATALINLTTSNTDTTREIVTASITSSIAPTTLTNLSAVQAGATVTITAPSGTSTTDSRPLVVLVPIATSGSVSIPGSGSSTTPTTLQLNGVPGRQTMFVFQQSSNGSTTFGSNNCTNTCGVQVKLDDNVDSNDVFWSFNNVDWRMGDTVPTANQHIMAGNVLWRGSTGPAMEHVTFDGGRILGPNNLPSNNFSSDSKVYAVASKGQPILFPVLQIQVPWNDTNTTTTFSDIDEDDVNNAATWMQSAFTTTFNLVLAQGDTPSRSNENNGGLGNFVRYLESWDGQSLNITGSFIQYKRSVYATGPFTTLVGTGVNAATDKQPYAGYVQAYAIANGNKALPYYKAPQRRYGFDVALLSQTPDLFSQRWSSNPPEQPNEYFREVSKDDNWIQAILCARQSATSSGYAESLSGWSGLSNYVVSPQDRPNCSTALRISS